MTDSVKVGILEDAEDMQAYIAYALNAETATEIAFQATTLAAAMAELERGNYPDICLVDLDLPDGNGAQFVSKLTQTTQCKALILTVLGDQKSVMSGFSSGAHGYLLKDTEPGQIVRHIRETMEGANPISAQVSKHLLDHYMMHKDGKETLAQPSSLTERETEILTLFAKGMSYKETARALGISTNTVNDYVKSIYGKLYVNSRNEAVFEALQMGWITV